MILYRPIAQCDPVRPDHALTLAGGWCWFTHAEVLVKGGSEGLIPAADIPADVRDRLTAPRADLLGLTMDAPRLMGILNVTPDSFSDGGRFDRPDAALAQARALAGAGADILDIGGESTRPGSDEVPVAEETARTAPVIAALRAEGLRTPISIDTRKAPVAEAAVSAGAGMVNDVAAMTFDPAMAGLVAGTGADLCLMHFKGEPKTMQVAPSYEDVTLEVYAFLEERIRAAEAAGIPRQRICVDPGIGFGKTIAHNLTLIRNLSVFHGLGCPILLGVSRKRFIGTIAGLSDAAARDPGTQAILLAGVAQGAQIHRIHDVSGARQALSIWRAINEGYQP